MKYRKRLFIPICAVAFLVTNYAFAQTGASAALVCGDCKPRSFPSLYDSNGKLVGPVMHAGCIGSQSTGSFDRVTVATKISGNWYYVCWSAAGLEVSHYLVFPTTDCSGTKYTFVFASPTQLFQVSAVANLGAGLELIEPDYSVPVQSMTIYSSLSFDGTCQPTMSGPYNLQAMKLGPPFSTMFTAPFHLQ